MRALLTRLTPLWFSSKLNFPYLPRTIITQNLLTLTWTADHDNRLQQNEKPTQKERIDAFVFVSHWKECKDLISTAQLLFPSHCVHNKFYTNDSNWLERSFMYEALSPKLHTSD